MTQVAKWSGQLETAFFSVHTRIPPDEIAEHEAARRLLRAKGLTVLEATQLALQHYKQVKKKPLVEIITAYEADRRKIGVSEAQITNVTKAARRLQRYLGDETEFHALVPTVFEDFMEAVFADKEVKPKTYNGFLGDVRTFVKWTVEKGYLGADPTKGVEERNVPDSIPTTIRPEVAEQLMRFMEAKHPGWVPYTAFCLFGAIRPAIRDGEAFRLDQALREGRQVFHEAGFDITGKANGIRLVPWEMCGPLKAWLESYTATKGLWPEATATKAERAWAGIRQEFELTQDVLRHTGISAMCYAANASLAQVAIAVGNSEQMIRKKYLGRWTKGDTAKLWSIVPTAGK